MNMGNVNGREDDGGGNSPYGVEEDSMNAEDVANSVRYGEFMGHSPPPSPRASHSSLMFRPQMPMVPLQRPDEMHVPSPSLMQTSSGFEELYHEQGTPTMFTWRYDGKEVALEGSWDNWKSRTLLEKSGEDFTVMKVLPSGVFQFRFIVDGQWRYAPDMPWTRNEAGNTCNTLDLQGRNDIENQNNDIVGKNLSKNAQKRLLKQQKYEAKKAEKKAWMKEEKKREAERKRREWEEKLASFPSEEERQKVVESRKELRKERMEKRLQEKTQKTERLREAIQNGQNIVVDLDFSHLMTPTELSSLTQQIMYCYAVNGRCAAPAHIWLTGCQGEMQNLLQRLPGYEKWVIEKESRSYLEAFNGRKNDLIYLTADSDTILDELDMTKIYIIGGLVDRNRWKGITMKKANDQGIHSAKLPIGSYLKMTSSKVLTVNQVMEILLKYLETRDWKDAFFQVIPQRKRCEFEEDDNGKSDEEDNGERNDQDTKKQCMKL